VRPRGLRGYELFDLAFRANFKVYRASYLPTPRPGPLWPFIKLHEIANADILVHVSRSQEFEGFEAEPIFRLIFYETVKTV